MLIFTQVDNAGKNAMFDSWDSGLIYPRPYDMDTQMGLDNVGIDWMPPSAELFTSEYGTDNSGLSATVDWRYQGEGRNKDPNEFRLTSYNTRNSRLWGFISKYYAADISSLYADLREDSTYDTDTICSFVNKLTSDLISES